MNWSNGVRPVRKSPLPDSGRRSSRRSNCSTLMPASAPLWALRLAVPVSVLVTASTDAPDPSILSAMLPRPSSRRIAEHLAEAALEIDVDELQVRGHRDAAVGTGKSERAFGDAAEGLRFADGDVELAVAHVGGDRGAAELRAALF